MADVIAGGQQVQGDVAHDATDAGRPVKIGGKASTSRPSAVASGDRVDAYLDEHGRPHVVVDPPDTATVSSVNDTSSSTTLLAANAARRGATIHNDSPVALYLKLGATASVTSYTALIQPGGYYEVPFGYTGQIDGIWAGDASGAARCTEIT